MRRAWVVAAIVCFVLVGALSAVAQETGGSFGGGSFGGGSSSSSSSSSGGSSSYGGSSGGSYGSSGGGGGGEMPAWMWWCSAPFVGILMVLLIWNASIPGGFAGRRRQRAHAKLWENAQVAVLRLGIDWRARREVQARLLELAQKGETGTPAGRALLLRDTITLLRGVELSWLYASTLARSVSGSGPVESAFRELTTDARARFKRELVRAVDGATSTTETPHELAAHAHEGEGVVVVTVVVAARNAPLAPEEKDPATGARRLLETMQSIADPARLAAMEVVWSPAAEEDRLSTAELEQFYPELRKIDEAAIAGRVFCAFCRGPFPMELRECPHCGAPIEAPE